MQNDQFSQKLQLIEAQKDLSQLKAAKMVPPLMLAKLSFLETLIAGEKMPQSIIQQLPYYQRENFEEMKAEMRIAIFVSIVRCLAGKEIITYFRRERAYLRKEKAFFGWKKCYIDCDTRHLTFFQSRKASVPFQQLQVSQLWVSRYYKYYKKKTIFAVYHQNIKYVVGLDQETTCKRIHQIITSLVSDNKDWKCTTFDPLQIKKQVNNRMGPESRQVQQAIICEQLQYLSSLHAKIMRMDQSNEGFKLLKNIDHGRLLVNDARGVIKASIIVKNTNQISLLQNYILQEWNSSVQILTVVAKPRNNSYIAYLRTNKYSFMSYPRQCYLSFTYYQSCQCRSEPNSENNSYLIIESVPNQSEPPASGFVRMDLQQVVELYRDKQNTNELLMTVTTLADFKGFASVQDKKAMSIHLFGNLAELIPYSQKQTRKALFEHLQCPCKRQGGRRGSRIVSDFSLPSEQNISNDDEQSVRNGSIERNAFKKASLKTADSQVIIMLEALLRGVKNEGILGLMQAKKHESYALRHRFKEKDEVIHIFEGENRDFLLQRKRWAFNGDQYDFVDQQVLAAQKDILKMIIKQLGSNLVSGKSIMNMSLPVQIFDKSSMLDLIAEGLGFLPYYLTKAANETNPIQQIKLVTCAFMFISATNPNIQKPFNPILGQTFQGRLGDFSVDLEQISHHPPISAIYMRSKEIQFHGNFEVTVDMGLNTAYSKVNNWFHLHILTTNSHYKIKMPDIQLGGLMYGNRTLKTTQKGFVYEQNSQLFTQMSIGKTKKRLYEREKIGAADLAGGIFKVRAQFGEKVMQQTGKKAFQGLKPEDVLQNCCFLSGKWYGNIKFDEVSYKSITEGPFPQKCERLKYLLPSDSIFREDVIFKIWKDNAGSNRQKQRLQNLQRADRKLRQRMKKK